MADGVAREGVEVGHHQGPHQLAHPVGAEVEAHQAVAIADGAYGATTVSATMALAHAAGIEVFATGGIGGVHRDARTSFDISADLTELAKTPVIVVCAGVKSILDLPATLEYLETVGVPVYGLGTSEFPAFYSAQSGLTVNCVADVATIARAWRAHRALSGGGMIIAVPPPPEFALDPAAIEQHIRRALDQADAAGIRGQAVTPFLLSAVTAETHGESMRTNMALLENNARVAAAIAVALNAV
ncbi:MAG: pseudouridine-5'-phosphate glycosidase [Chloroflexia bacterium]|nr:pseudouridine-5'-phosphate glycosidase [Chloroflexia bacterium]